MANRMVTACSPSLHEHRQAHHAGHEQRGELPGPSRSAYGQTYLRQHVGEHEHEQDGLHQRAYQKRHPVPAQDAQVAQQQRPKRCERGGVSRRVACGTLLARRWHGVGNHSLSSFPVRLMNAVSRVGSATEKSVTATRNSSAVAMTTARTPSASPRRERCTWLSETRAGPELSGPSRPVRTAATFSASPLTPTRTSASPPSDRLSVG